MTQSYDNYAQKHNKKLKEFLNKLQYGIIWNKQNIRIIVNFSFYVVKYTILNFMVCYNIVVCTVLLKYPINIKAKNV